jgi:hypothetical protein
MSKKYNGVSTENIDGFISKAIKVEAGDGKLLVTPDPKMIQIIEDGEFYKIVVVAPVFKHYFQTNLENVKLSVEDVYTQIEIPEIFFTQEVRLVCKSGRPVEFRLIDEPVKNPVTQFVPQIVVKEDAQVLESEEEVEDGN